VLEQAPDLPVASEGVGRVAHELRKSKE